MVRHWVGWMGVAACLAMLTGPAGAQKPVVASRQATVAKVDDALVAAQGWIGRALFVRGFYAANDLQYDLSGTVLGTPKAVDWTLAGMDVQSIARTGPQEIQLDGVRVAIRYNPDNHFFERHPQKDMKMKVRVATVSTDGTVVAVPGAFDRTLGAIFAIGIDPAMQKSMPDFWRHYFDPKLVWPADALSGSTIYGNGSTAPVQPEQLLKITHGVAPEFTVQAEHDKVQGTVGVRLVVDKDGVARHLTIVRPVGYGLDAKAVEALEKTKFEPAQLKGTPVPSTVDLTEEFKLVTTP